MSVYTPQQIGQQQTQQPYGQQFGQQPWMGQGQFGGQQQPWGQQGQGQFGMQGQQQMPLLVTELSLRCASSAVTAVVEQLRMDPQILMGIQAQGQIPPHAFSAVLTECARRIAPVVHMALGQVSGQGQASPYGQPGQGQFGQLPGQQAQGQFGQLQGPGQGQPGQGQFGQQPWDQMRGQLGQSGQFPGLGQGSLGQPQFGLQPGM